MKLIISHEGSLMIDLADPGAIAAISKAVPVFNEGYGGDAQWKPHSDRRIEMVLVPDENVGNREETVQRLIEESANKDKRWVDRWVDQYNQAQAFKKERDDLQKQLDEIRAKVSA